MIVYKKIFGFVFVFFFLSSMCVAQEELLHFEDRCGRISDVVAATTSPARIRADFEYVPEQQKKLANLREQYEQIVSGFTYENATENSKIAFLAKISVIENEILNKVLLPHQTAMVKEKIFSTYLIAYEGNFLKAILENYSYVLSLSKGQAEKLGEIESDAAKRIEEAKKKFEKELKEIRASVENQIEETLTKEQLNSIKELQGKS